MNFTDEQNSALEAGGRVLVSAAAGSGKTAVLVEKVVKIISDENNPVDIDKLLIVTFTNAAAGEMKTRISKRLSEKIKENPDSFHLKKQKLLISATSICTIDSLCISLAREYFYKLGISADFKIADESVINRLKNNCIDEILAENFENPDDDFLKLVSIFGGERADEKLKENIFKIYNYLCTLPFPDEYIDKVNKLYSDFNENSVFFDIVFDYAFEILKNSISIFAPHYEELISEPVLYKGYGDAFSEINAKLRRALEFVEKRDYNGIYNMLKLYSSAKLKSVRNYSDEVFRDKMKAAKSNAESAFKKLKKVFNCSLSEIFNDMKMLCPVINKFLKLTSEFSKRFYELKIENNSFGFSDIETEVLKLLVKKENNDIVFSDEAKEMSKKYYAVLVDEYQDTNDLQNTIFTALSDNGKKLFMVGDVKQSIYGFRKANPKNFLKSRSELPLYKKGSNCSKVIMSGNFRSCSQVCDFVNFLFYRLLSEKCGEMFYEDEDKLVPKAVFKNVSQNRVSLDIVSPVNDKFSSVEHQAYHIVSLINDKINSGKIITDGDELRSVQYKDICILLRSRVEIAMFAEVLKKAGIPVWADDKEGLLDEAEIINLTSLLDVIDNPFSDIPLLTLLLSDIYGFSADEVANIRAKSPKKGLFEALIEYSKDNKKACEFLEQINEFRKFATTSSVSELINKVLSETGYENTVYLYENGEACYNNLLLYKDIAKNFEENNLRGLSAFIRYIKRQRKNGNTMQKSGLSGENDNAVRIMTMHRSKGLQFPICILACLNKKFNKVDNTADVLLSEKCGIGMNYIDLERGIKYSTFPRNAAVIESKAAIISEEMRLLYVAMTRAKDFLIMVGFENDIKKSVESISDNISLDSYQRFNPYFVMECDNFLKMITAGALFHKCGNTLREFSGTDYFNVTEGDLEINIIDKINFEIKDNSEESEKQDFDKARYNELCKILEYKYPYRDLNKIFIKQSASALAHKEISADYEFSSVPVFLNNQRMTAAEKGTAMHKFMQFCDFNKAASDINVEKERLRKEGKLTQTEADSLNTNNLKAFFESEIGREACLAKELYKEQGFMVEVPANAVHDNLGNEFNGENIIIQGYVDLCYCDGDGITIVDYKTDRADEEELINRYKSQLDIYALALTQTFSKKVLKKAIYSFYLKKLVII